MHRRRFLSYLAASPLATVAEEWVPRKPEEALNLFDFEAAARKALPPAHYGYMATGVEDDRTLEANRNAYSRYHLRPRRLVDVSQIDQSVTLFGNKYPSPILLAPTGSGKAFHPEGELGVARAAKAKGAPMILSTATTTGVEAVNESYGAPVWYQLYPTSSFNVTERLVKRAEKAGCRVLVITVDLPAGRKTETQQRFTRLDTRTCSNCHTQDTSSAAGLGVADYFRRKPMFDGLDMKGVNLFQPALTWNTIRRIRELTDMKVVIKGIMTREDAELCRTNKVDGLIVSNHGGRAEESGLGTLEALPEVLQGAGANLPVFLDGGIRRGTDIFKALALGARAVAIGRPYLWGNAAFGQPGVEAVLQMLRSELDLVMKQCGTRNLTEITRPHIGRP